MKAVHFGAGNIGRGFVGVLLHQGGYEVVFSDVAAELVTAISEADTYTVREVGPGGTDTVVTGFRAINSAEDPSVVADEVATAQVVTTAVGPTVLRFIAPHIVAGLQRRSDETAPLQVMACENAIGASDTLAQHVAEAAGEQWDQLKSRAVFANTAVDRIVPGQPAGHGIDVTVEPFFEWAIESGPFAGELPQIPGAHFVEELGPYIERKLYTVNTGHAAAAYLGYQAGVSGISDALATEEVSAGVEAALEETSALLCAKHGFSAEEMSQYRHTILQRFRNEALPDTVQRVGRQPLRKLSRHERFIGPAAEAAERGLSVEGLLRAVSAAVTFHDDADEQSQQLHQMRGELSAEQFVESVTGISPQHPLYQPLLEAVRA